MKKKYIILITIFLLVFYCGFAIYACADYIKTPTLIKSYDKICSKNKEDMTEAVINFCQDELNKREYQFGEGFISMHTSIIYTFSIILFPVFFLTIATGIIYASKFLKSKELLYYQTRISYKSVVWKILKESYRYIWILPLVMIGVFICEIIYAGWDTSISLVLNNTGWSDFLVSHRIFFIVIYLVSIILFLATYINIGLIWTRKCKNYIISLISSFLTIMALQLIVEQLWKYAYLESTINFFNLFILDDDMGLWKNMLFIVSCFVISSFSVYLAYKNKEKLYLSGEE